MAVPWETNSNMQSQQTVDMTDSSRVSAALLTLADQIERDNLSGDAVLTRLDDIFEILRMVIAVQDANIDDNIFVSLREIEHRVHIEELSLSAGSQRLEIPRETLRTLVLSGITIGSIADMFAVSPSTVRRRMVEEGLRIGCHSAGYSALSPKCWLENDVGTSTIQKNTHSKIERLWRDVYENILDLFYTMFTQLEIQGLLNPGEEIDLFALHRCFLHHIQHHLQAFKEAWNQHGLRTENNCSPLQLWSLYRKEGHDFSQVPDDYGIDWTGPHSHLPSTEITIPEIQLPRLFSQQELAKLPHTNVPLSQALQVYIQTVHALKHLLHSDF
ncbi:uncharacterized protein LOC121628755 [Melanotaenia boesemani]|uniref:uncharacterized protein LOC121628755 n=1 Tax=Melanotaenia boesemani TaxID=1250792 RepID=UPI001C0424AB|nr:uncharacterized protein LOC121628755 [Melanotaenia boesemani]